jgi:hypothetical protein
MISVDELCITTGQTTTFDIFDFSCAERTLPVCKRVVFAIVIFFGYN